tara:strand:- start:29682 stop:29903 length:222 start_codon:yes stop_codon:yes gene_type:complete
VKQKAAFESVNFGNIKIPEAILRKFRIDWNTIHIGERSRLWKIFEIRLPEPEVMSPDTSERLNTPLMSLKKKA